MSKVAALEEMYLIYQVFRSYLTEPESWGEHGAEELTASYRSFCQREPVGDVSGSCLGRIARAGEAWVFSQNPIERNTGGITCPSGSPHQSLRQSGCVAASCA
jgi:hypothetical protein